MQVAPQFCGSPRRSRSSSSERNRQVDNSARPSSSNIAHTAPIQSRSIIAKIVSVCNGKFHIRREGIDDEGHLESQIYAHPNNVGESLPANVPLGGHTTKKSIFQGKPSLLVGWMGIDKPYRRSTNPKNDAVGQALYADIIHLSDAHSCNGNAHLKAHPSGIPHFQREWSFEKDEKNTQAKNLREQKKAVKDALKTAPNNPDKLAELSDIQDKMKYDFRGNMIASHKAIAHSRSLEQTVYREDRPPTPIRGKSNTFVDANTMLPARRFQIIDGLSGDYRPQTP